jgi:hypothetical protein
MTLKVVLAPGRSMASIAALNFVPEGPGAKFLEKNTVPLHLCLVEHVATLSCNMWPNQYVLHHPLPCNAHSGWLQKCWNILSQANKQTSTASAWSSGSAVQGWNHSMTCPHGTQVWPSCRGMDTLSVTAGATYHDCATGFAEA